MSTKAEKTMTDVAAIVIAVAIAIAGFLTLLTHLPAASSTQSAGTVVAAAGSVAQPAATTTLTEESISSAVLRTLAAQGSAWFLPTDQAQQMLPASVVNVLEARGVVLQVQLGQG